MSFSVETSSQRGRILILHSDKERANRFAELFAPHGLDATICNDGTMALAVVYNEPPDVILVHEDIGPHGGTAVAQSLKEDNVFAHLPILLLLRNDEIKKLPISHDLPFDDFIEEDTDEAVLVARVLLSIIRAHRQLDANPLTRLPGNNSIAKELDSRIAQRDEFAIVYCDIDQFKSFNDRYGFARGDEALKLTARLMLNSVASESPADHYVGHVGGDDFVIIVPADRAQVVCERFIANFDGIIPSLYDDDDRERGSIGSVNRKGQRETFPIMSISLAVVVNLGGEFGHAGEIVSIAAEIKKELKKSPGSGYMVNRWQCADPRNGQPAVEDAEEPAPQAVRTQSL